MDKRQDEVVWLSINEPPRKRRRVGVYVLGALAVLVGVGASGAMLVKIAAIIAEKNRPAVVLAPRSSDEVFAESYRVFSDFDGANAPPSDDEYAEIQSVIEKIAECSANDDDAGFVKLVDSKRLHRLVELHGGYFGIDPIDKPAARRQAVGVSVEPFWCSPTIVGVETPAGDPDTRTVYIVSTYPDDEEQFECRLLLGRVGSTWKLYDWQRLDLGLTNTQFIAAWIQTVLASNQDQFGPWLTAVREADEAIAANGDGELAGRRLKEAEQVVPSGELRDYCLLLTGYRWQSAGRWEDALRCFKAVQAPDRFPGAYFGIHNCIKDDAPEEALNHARAYATLIGPSASACRIQAELLARLNRKEESLVMWREVLRSTPADTTALLKTLIGLADDKKEQVLPLLRRCDDPAVVAAETAALLGYQDYNGLRVLADYLQESAPDTDGYHNARGALHYMDGRYADAMASYLSAIKTSEDQSAYVWSYLDAAASAGEIAGAIEVLPDPESAFEEFFYAYDDGQIAVSTEELHDVVAKRFEAKPEDAEVALRMSEVLGEGGRTDEAEELIRKTLQKLDGKDLDEDSEYLRESLSNDLVRLLYRTGRWEQAYPGTEPNDDALDSLVRLAASERRLDVLKSLNDRAQAADAGEASLAALAGEIALIEGRPSDAARHFKRAADSVEDQYGWIYRHSQLNACLKAGEWRAYYESADDPAEAFDRLSYELIDRKEWDSLQQLWALHESQSEAAPAILLSKSRSAWARKDYHEYLRHSSEIILNKPHDLAAYEFDAVENQRLIALLQIHEHGAAKQFADSREDEALLAIVYAATGNVASAQRSARKVAIANPSLTRLYQHDLMGPRFLSAEYESLHDEFPVSLPYGASQTVAVLYAAQPRAITSPDIREAIDQLEERPQSTVRSVAAHAVGIEQVATLAVGDATVWVVTRSSRPNEGFRVNDGSPPWATLVDAPPSWVAVGVSAWTNGGREGGEVVARQLAARLFSGHEGAVRLKPQGGYLMSAVYRNQADLLSAWGKAGELEDSVDDRVELKYFDESDIAAERVFVDGLFAAFRTLKSSPGQRLQVAVEVPGVEGFGAHWLEVEKAERSYGALEFSGPLLSESPLLPVLREGTPIRTGSHSVVAWRWANDAKAITWRQP